MKYIEQTINQTHNPFGFECERSRKNVEIGFIFLYIFHAELDGEWHDIIILDTLPSVSVSLTQNDNHSWASDHIKYFYDIVIYAMIFLVAHRFIPSIRNLAFSLFAQAIRIGI